VETATATPGAHGHAPGSRQAGVTRKRVVIETERHLIIGQVTLPAGGYRSRFSDMLNRSDLAFIPLVAAHITTLDGEESQHRPFVAVARSAVLIAYEEEE
jgi:uncharacterized protein DUF6812